MYLNKHAQTLTMNKREWVDILNFFTDIIEAGTTEYPIYPLLDNINEAMGRFILEDVNLRADGSCIVNYRISGSGSGK
jgi:hypothetical protein